MNNAERVLELLMPILAATYQTPTDMMPMKLFLTDKSRYPAFDLEGLKITAERFAC
ncbi:hypothetical protein COCC4DRAFT_45371 [Bipolaris maydis ATCC 48331]|uniref:Uncharacterized protein n=2 Tax=Cochliobolus heterostrophus TaxID=5016 RepID=M2TTN6_COCH5|nr:uncharacterized protein COCC4DRAFT_45371 [Bipolaris maydis ATCC 48331]EMD85141.1 hypothetical protein COCHEDRAFT_1219527 [Bipolaris maydis C5]ENH99400.1 hypothetical protein COCC4DRAFT_45371 [Bipolaris maydis ATCC 48331]